MGLQVGRVYSEYTEEEKKDYVLMVTHIDFDDNGEYEGHTATELFVLERDF